MGEENGFPHYKRKCGLGETSSQAPVRFDGITARDGMNGIFKGRDSNKKT
jgi:hypothetical protein